MEIRKRSNIELHVHPFLGRNRITDVVEAMEKTGLDVVAMEALDTTIYPDMIRQTAEKYKDSTSDKAGIRLPDGKYLLNAREYNTKEDLHILTVGYSFDDADPSTEIRRIIDSGLENRALIILDHPFVDNIKTKTAGHISERLELELEKICREYSGSVALEWNAYCIPWMRGAIKTALNLLGAGIRYHDVNKKAEKLSQKLAEEGYNIPVVVDTDLHGRTRSDLMTMGTARIITDLEGECASDAVSSLKRNIFEGKYENVKRYVSSAHLLRSFCVPILFPNIFEKPRA